MCSENSQFEYICICKESVRLKHPPSVVAHSATNLDIEFCTRWKIPGVFRTISNRMIAADSSSNIFFDLLKLKKQNLYRTI